MGRSWLPGRSALAAFSAAAVLTISHSSSHLAKLTVVVLTALIMTGWYLVPWDAASVGAALGLLTVALSSLAALYQKRKRA